MARIINLCILFAISFSMLRAQTNQITVSGTVTDEKGFPMSGVTVQVEESTIGTVTDANGNFSLKAPLGSTILFSFVGFVPVKHEAIASPLQIVMKEDVIMMSEVVVTALGMGREKKALAYSITELREDAFLVKESSLAAGLAGKVAGINVVRPTTGVMGSTRITIRGNGSFGNNQPLYIVDGVPIDNSNYGQPGVWGGYDGGDGISSFNSDDIESMTILKGSTAAALYGSRAANGAIVITTKRGAKGRVRVELNSSYTFDKPVVKTSDFQYEYGQGLSGIAPLTLEMAMLSGPASWGGRLDGSDVIQFDGAFHPYIAVGKKNFSNFYNNAWRLNNNLSISGGGENIFYRVSVGDQRYHDLYPNSTMERNNSSLNLTVNLTQDVTLQTGIMYLRERVKNRQNVNDYASNGNVLLWTLPPNIDIRTLAPATDANGNELLLSNAYVYFANPYFIAYKRRQEDAKDRIFSSVQLRYDMNKNWYLRGRVGGDIINRRSETVLPKGTGYYQPGSISVGSSYSGEVNAEVLLGFNKSFNEAWSCTSFAGWNSMVAWSESISAYGDRFIQPEFNVIGNTETTSGGKSKWENYINSLFGQVELSYNNLLFLTFSGRNDWFSALSMKGKTTPNHIFYPSAGMSYLISEAIKLPSWLSFLKVRGSWAQSGGSVSPYNLTLTYQYGETIHGCPTGSISNSTIPNPNLKPLTSTSYEVGTDVRFFNNRVGIDFTYYVRNTRDDIVTAQISSASGYSHALVNAGKIDNRGVELLLSATPLETEKIKWNTVVNFSYNKSKIVRITDRVNSFIMANSRTGAAGDEGTPAYIYQEVGEPYGIIKGSSYVRDENDNIVYGKNGLPIKGEIKKLGVGVHPYTIGFGNTFTFSGFSLYLLIDGKFGGSIFSGTNDMAYFLGTHINTLQGRESGVIGKGIKMDGTPNDIAVPAMDYYMYIANNIAEEFVYDASFIKLREIALSYDLPKRFITKIGLSQISFSLVGRNLHTFYSKIPMVDPESGYTIGNAQGLEQWGLPASRNWGFNLNIHF
jgi:TonB-linked SusC/RagA family outer membrane protein